MDQAMTLAAWITVLATVLVGSTGSGGFVYWLLNRKSQEVQDNKIKADRESTLAEAATKWQVLADESATKAYERVKDQCDECLDKLGGMHDVAGNLIDALEALLAEDTPQSRADARASVRLARRAMTI
jgi:hypothetical protein